MSPVPTDDELEAQLAVALSNPDLTVKEQEKLRADHFRLMTERRERQSRLQDEYDTGKGRSWR